MTINLEYLDNLNNKRREILIEQIKNTHDVESLNKIPKSEDLLYYCAQKRLLELYNKPYKEAEFVGVGNRQNKFIKLLVFEGNSEDIRIKKIKDFLKCTFDVVFDDNNFAGDSYQLAMYVAVYALIYDRNIKENLVFSGEFKTDHFYTSKFEEKNNFCTKNKKQLIGGEFLSITEVIGKSFKPRKVLIWAKDDDSKTPVGFKRIKIGTLPKQSWVNIIKKTASEILPDDYLALNGPSTFAFGLGAELGSTRSYTFLNFDYSTGDYTSPIRATRNLKEINDKIDKININLDNITDKNINILFYFASHAPKPPTNKQYIYIEAKDKKGFIPLEEYGEIVRQINSAINMIKMQYKLDSFNLVFSMPVGMAFLLGWAVGKFLNADVYNYFPDTDQYCKVFNLNELGH
jgi:hypothetical protein